jgi:hypothetical protein
MYSSLRRRYRVVLSFLHLLKQLHYRDRVS